MGIKAYPMFFSEIKEKHWICFYTHWLCNKWYRIWN